MGDSACILPLITSFIALYTGQQRRGWRQVLQRNVYRVELDATRYAQRLENIRQRWGGLPAQHSLTQSDFFCGHFLAPQGAVDALMFTHIVGNPPFGGTFGLALQDVAFHTLDQFSGETNHPVVVLDFTKSGSTAAIGLLRGASQD